MNTDPSRYPQEGYVIIRGFLAGEELATLQREVDRYIREVVPNLPPEDAFYQDRAQPESLKQLPRMARDPFFAEYRTNATWLGMARQLLGENCESKDGQWFNKPPGAEHPTPPHQDNFYFCLEPPSVLTMWLALDHVDEENGCLRFVPRSHLAGLRPHGQTKVLGFSQGITDYGDADLDAEVKVCVSPGDVVIHHGETIHRADPNRSQTRHRRAFAAVFQGESCRENPEARQRYFASLNAQHTQLGVKAS